MSHASVLVIGPHTMGELEQALAPFDEALLVEPYVEMTRHQQIAERRSNHANAAETRRRLEAEKPRDGETQHPEYIRWITTDAPSEALLDDDALWKVILEREPWDERDKNGDLWSTLNPIRRLDWWVIGGRWSGSLGPGG